MSKNLIDPADVREVIDRHSWADENTDCKSVLDDVLRDLRNLLPRDCPEDMLGLWATHPEYGRVLVCSTRPYQDGEVIIAYRDDDVPTGTAQECVDHSSLTFPEPHPEYLTTLEEYENAPEGTVVAAGEAWPYILRQSVWERSSTYSDADGMAGVTRRVLRWGWVK